MAVNPMQRKARNSFLLGMLLMLVIAGVVIALLIVQLKNYSDKEAEELAAKVSIYVLGQDVKSGQTITSDMLVVQEVNMYTVPEDAIGDLETFENYNLQDREGNAVITRYDEETDESTMYITRDGEEYELQQEENTGDYFITVGEERQYIELNSIPLVAKVDMTANTILTRQLVASADNISTDSVRREEYNMIVLPYKIETGDYVDIRLVLPGGQNYIVISKKEVTVPNIAGIPSEDTIWMNLSEEEILLLSNAIVEAYRIDGAKLYANTYTEPGMQDAAIITYTPSREVADLIQANPNIVEEAKVGLASRYDANQRNNIINQAITSAGEAGDSNVAAGVEEDITATEENRRNYLEGLSAEAEAAAAASAENTTSNTTSE